MERVFRFANRFQKTIWVSLALVGQVAVAGVTLAPPVQPADIQAKMDDEYLDSHFGQQPARPTLGLRAGYAAEAVEDMDNQAVDPLSPKIAGRSPAGMMYTDTPNQPAAGAVPNPIRPVTREAGLAAGVRNVTPEPEGISRRGVQEVSLIAGDLGFFPRTVFVTRDIPVRLFVTGASKNTLCIMMDSFHVRKQVRSQKIEEITFTPARPGQYRYYCPVNGMEGTLVVKEFSTRSDDASNLVRRMITPGENTPPIAEVTKVNLPTAPMGRGPAAEQAALMGPPKPAPGAPAPGSAAAKAGAPAVAPAPAEGEKVDGGAAEEGGE